MKKSETLYKVRKNANCFEVAFELLQLPFQTLLPSSMDVIRMLRVRFTLPVFSCQKGALNQSLSPRYLLWSMERGRHIERVIQLIFHYGLSAAPKLFTFSIFFPEEVEVTCSGQVLSCCVAGVGLSKSVPKQIVLCIHSVCHTFHLCRKGLKIC